VSSAFDALPADARRKLRRSAQPEFIAPMLATLTEERFSRDGWLFERKLDGERCLAFHGSGRLRLLSRNEKPLNGTYPELIEPLLAGLAADFVVDGEVVAFAGGQTSFARLQQRMQLRDPLRAQASAIPVFYYLFDLLYLDAYDVRQLELRHRKALLRRAFSFSDPIRFTTHRNREGVAYYREACRRGWEGVIAKRADSPYVSRRTRDWLKFKCVNEQEFVIGGYTDPRGTRLGFGALLVGYYEDGRLVYAGKVGTGYDQATLLQLRERLRALEQEQPPFAADGLPRRNVHWVQPVLVAQIGFTELTRDGKLRHPRFLGLRRDKHPREVVLERAER
jgi:bifunctional non-homologous end joining protein LigD